MTAHPKQSSVLQTTKGHSSEMIRSHNRSLNNNKLTMRTDSTGMVAENCACRNSHTNKEWNCCQKPPHTAPREENTRSQQQKITSEEVVVVSTLMPTGFVSMEQTKHCIETPTLVPMTQLGRHREKALIGTGTCGDL